MFEFLKDMDGNLSIKKITAILTLLSSLMGGGAYMANEHYTDSDAPHYMTVEAHKESILQEKRLADARFNQHMAMLNVKLVNMELSLTRIELIMLLGIPEAQLTPDQRHKISMLQTKERNLLELLN